MFYFTCNHFLSNCNRIVVSYNVWTDLDNTVCNRRVMKSRGQLLHCCSSVSSSLSGAAANCWDDILTLKLSEMTEQRKALVTRVLGVFTDNCLHLCAANCLWDTWHTLTLEFAFEQMFSRFDSWGCRAQGGGQAWVGLECLTEAVVITGIRTSQKYCKSNIQHPLWTIRGRGVISRRSWGVVRKWGSRSVRGSGLCRTRVSGRGSCY